MGHHYMFHWSIKNRCRRKTPIPIHHKFCYRRKGVHIPLYKTVYSLRKKQVIQSIVGIDKSFDTLEQAYSVGVYRIYSCFRMQSYIPIQSISIFLQLVRD